MRDGRMLVFKLSNHPGSLGLSCGKDGMALAGVTLLRKTANGVAPPYDAA
jgi:hypothetical protein